MFDTEYERIRAALNSDPNRLQFADLESTRPRHEWARLRSDAIDRCRAGHCLREGPGCAASVAEAVPTSGLQSESASDFGAEIPLKDEALRLKGRADSVVLLSPGLIEVRDFKTGPATDADTGEIKLEYAVQLRCYGLMIRRRHPDCAVRLVVDDGVEHHVSFGLEEQAATLEWLMAAMEDFPEPGLTDAATLARPGSECKYCSFRLVCAAYRSSAPQWWRDYPSDLVSAPYDTWGTVVGIQLSATADVSIRDDANRSVRVSRLDARHGLDESVVGRRMWAFSLGATGAVKDFQGRRLHPRSFHEMPRDASERRAWVATVFVE